MGFSHLLWRTGVALRTRLPWHKATIYDIAPKALWEQEIATRRVRRQKHPSVPLVVYNYGPEVQWDNHWNAVTLASRGLIAHAETGEIVARPMKKFFNVGQAGAPAMPQDARVRVADKVDGSMGVLYPCGDDTFAVATRGSFASEQAQHATQVWRERYADAFTPPAGTTLIFEIIYPEGRIVRNYGGLDDLVFLTAIDNKTGRTVLDKDNFGWPGPVVEVFPYTTLGEALAAPERPGDAEGFVIHFLDTDERAKLKQSEYKRLHSLMTTLSTTDLWENLAVSRMVGDGLDVKTAARHAGIPVSKAQAIADAGERWLAPLLEDTPDEFNAWITSSLADWDASADQFVKAMRAEFDAIEFSGDPSERVARKEIVATIAQVTGVDKHRFSVFMALVDGKSIVGQAFQSCKPAFAKAFWNEDPAV